MSKKTNNTTTQKEKLPRNVSILFQRSFEHYRDMHAENLAQSMIKNARDEDKILSIEALLNKEEIEWTEWVRLKEKYPSLDRADRIIKQILSAKREHGAIVRDFDASFIYRSMPAYNDRWKELEEWRAQLNKQEDKTQTINVTLEAIPASHLVPERVDE